MIFLLTVLFINSAMLGMEKNLPEKLILVSSDQQKITVDREVFCKFSPAIAVIADYSADHKEESEINFSQIDGQTLRYFADAAELMSGVEYRYTKENGDSVFYYPLQHVKKNLKKLSKRQSKTTLIKLLQACDMLEIKSLIEFASYRLAQIIDVEKSTSDELKHYDLPNSVKSRIVYYKNLSDNDWPHLTVFDVIRKNNDKKSNNMIGQGITDLEGLDYVPELGKITNLCLLHNLLTYVPAELLVTAQSLRTLRLHYNLISELHVRSMRGLDALDTLDLSHNELTQVPTKALQFLTRLRDLRLDSNKIRILKNYAFTGLFNLRVLQLNDNQINSIQTHAFHGLGTVEYLSVDGNDLQHVDPNVFEVVKKAMIIRN